MQIKSILIILNALALFGIIFSSVVAHGAPASLEEAVGDYLIVVQYSPDELPALEPVRFDFSIFDKRNNEELPFGDIWLRLNKENKVLLATALAQPSFGAAGLTYVFAESGGYELFLRFQNGEGSIAEASFSLTVNTPEGSSRTSFFSLNTLLVLLGGTVLGFLIFAIIKKTKV